MADRSGRIRGMGVFQIVLGSLCGLLTLILALAGALQGAAPPPTGPEQSAPLASVALSVIIYAALSASLIWVGAGALRLRRWVPKVVLAVNWPFLVIGAVATAASIWLVPIVMRISMASATARGAPGLSPAMSEGIVTITTVVTVVVLFVIYVVIPGLHVLLFSGRDVQETCDRHDPARRWTDDLPASVVALVVWLGASSLSWVGMGLAGFGLLFGLVLTGVPSLLLGLFYAAASVALALWTARRTPASWWAATAFFALMFAASLSTFFLMDLGELYRRSGLLPEHQIAAMEPAMREMTVAARVSGAVCGAAILACMIYMKRHFRKGAA